MWQKTPRSQRKCCSFNILNYIKYKIKVHRVYWFLSWKHWLFVMVLPFIPVSIFIEQRMITIWILMDLPVVMPNLLPIPNERHSNVIRVYFFNLHDFENFKTLVNFEKFSVKIGTGDSNKWYLNRKLLKSCLR
jgi:hypothetical protein